MLSQVSRKIKNSINIYLFAHNKSFPVKKLCNQRHILIQKKLKTRKKCCGEARISKGILSLCFFLLQLLEGFYCP